VEALFTFTQLPFWLEPIEYNIKGVVHFKKKSMSFFLQSKRN